MNRFFALMNHRTILMILVAILSVWIVITYQIGIDTHMMLYSLVVAFPMVFSLQSAFKRREKALEYLGAFKGGLLSAWQSFLLSKKLTPELISRGREVFTKAGDAMVDHLHKGQPVMQDVYNYFDDVMKFLRDNREEVSGRILIRVSRCMHDVYESAAYLSTQKTHRTMRVLRLLAFIFIHVFPFFQAAVLYNVFRHEYPTWMIYLVSVFTAVVLITLYNVQRNMEFSFDQKGYDDIKVEEFRIKLN